MREGSKCFKIVILLMPNPIVCLVFSYCALSNHIVLDEDETLLRHLAISLNLNLVASELKQINCKIAKEIAKLENEGYRSR